MNEDQKYEIIKNLVDNNGNKDRAALTLGCTRRTIDRMISTYEKEGKAGFVHGNRGRQPVHSIKDEVKREIAVIYENKYYDANISHFTELLKEHDAVAISESTVRNILRNADILSPKAHRRTRKELKKKLEAQLQDAVNKKETESIKTRIMEIEDAHPRRARSSKFGEMIQMDASLHLWFGDKKTTLHLAIDDATGIIVGAWFEEQETLRGYYNVLKQILEEYGIPYMFYTDRRTVFEYRRSGSQDTADDSFTQFGYACKQLGILVQTTSVPQAKGRIERLNGTMQSRLPVELRLKGVTTMEQANEFLPGFIANYNARFALKTNSIPSVFAPQPTSEKTDQILAVVTERTVDSGHSIRFENKYWRTVNKNGMPIYYYKGTKGLVIKTFSDNLYFSTDEGIYALEEIPIHERTSKNFDIKPVEQQSKARYIPPANHPWRLAAFVAFVKKQNHRVNAPA